MQIEFKLSEKEFREEELEAVKILAKSLFKMNFIFRWYYFLRLKKHINLRYKIAKLGRKYIGGTCIFVSKKILINLEKISKNIQNEIEMIKTIEEVITHEALHYTLRQELKNEHPKKEEEIVTELAEESLSLN